MVAIPVMGFVNLNLVTYRYDDLATVASATLQLSQHSSG